MPESRSQKDPRKNTLFSEDNETLSNNDVEMRSFRDLFKDSRPNPDFLSILARYM